MTTRKRSIDLLTIAALGVGLGWSARRAGRAAEATANAPYDQLTGGAMPPYSGGRPRIHNSAATARVDKSRRQLENALDDVRGNQLLWKPENIRMWRSNWRLMDNEMNRQLVCDGTQFWDASTGRPDCDGDVRSYASWISRTKHRERAAAAAAAKKRTG